MAVAMLINNPDASKESLAAAFLTSGAKHSPKLTQKEPSPGGVAEQKVDPAP